MMYIDVDPEADAAAQRAARGDHDLELEDAMEVEHSKRCANGSIHTDATTGKLMTSLASAVDVTMRFMMLREPALLAYPFYSMQIGDAPLRRAWSLIAPKLGLLDLSVAGAAALSRQQLRIKIRGSGSRTR